MHRFKNIGIVIDPRRTNKDVLAHARELVHTNGASVHLLCILPKSLTETQKHTFAARLASKIDFTHSIKYLYDKPVVDITYYCADNKLDILLIEPDYHEGVINRFFQGSITLSLMRKAPCPVWVVKRPVSNTYQRILIAVDADETHVDPALNDKLIEIGTSYANRQHAECYLVTAWALEGEMMLAGPFLKTPAEEIERLRTEQKILCASAFENLQKRHTERLHGCQTQMLNGDPGFAISNFIEKKEIDLVVMGTIARAGIKGFLIGNTAEKIVNQIDCSIMAIKPDGFVSPILP